MLGLLAAPRSDFFRMLYGRVFRGSAVHPQCLAQTPPMFCALAGVCSPLAPPASAQCNARLQRVRNGDTAGAAAAMIPQRSSSRYNSHRKARKKCTCAEPAENVRQCVALCSVAGSREGAAFFLCHTDSCARLRARMPCHCLPREADHLHRQRAGCHRYRRCTAGGVLPSARRSRSSSTTVSSSMAASCAAAGQQRSRRCQWAAGSRCGEVGRGGAGSCAAVP